MSQKFDADTQGKHLFVWILYCKIIDMESKVNNAYYYQPDGNYCAIVLWLKIWGI